MLLFGGTWSGQNVITRFHSEITSVTQLVGGGRNSVTRLFVSSQTDRQTDEQWVSEWVVSQRHISTIGYTAPFTSEHAGKYTTGDKLNIQTIQKLNTTQKKLTKQNTANRGVSSCSSLGWPAGWPHLYLGPRIPEVLMHDWVTGVVWHQLRDATLWIQLLCM